MQRIVLITALGFVIAARAASAQPGAEPPPPAPEPAPPPAEPPPPVEPPPPTPAPAMTVAPPPPGTAPVTVVASAPGVLPNLLSTAAGMTIDLQADYISIDGADGITFLAMKAHGQFISPGGAGGYASLPFTYLTGDGVPESVQGIGNLEVGALYAIRSNPQLDVLLRGGISLDTAAEEDAEFLLYGHLFPRLTDVFTQAGLGTTWARVQGSMVHSSGNIRFGGMAGADVPVSGEAQDEIDALVNVAVSAGFQQGNVGAAIGLTMVQTVGVSGDEENYSGLNLSGNIAAGPTMRVIGLLGFNVGGDSLEIDGFSLGVGLRVGM